MRCWGDNLQNQLNLGNVLQINARTAIPALQGADEEARGASHTCPMKNDRVRGVRCMGVAIEAIDHTNDSPSGYHRS